MSSNASPESPETSRDFAVIDGEAYPVHFASATFGDRSARSDQKEPGLLEGGEFSCFGCFLRPAENDDVSGDVGLC